MQYIATDRSNVATTVLCVLSIAGRDVLPSWCQFVLLAVVQLVVCVRSLRLHPVSHYSRWNTHGSGKPPVCSGKWSSKGPFSTSMLVFGSVYIMIKCIRHFLKDPISPSEISHQPLFWESDRQMARATRFMLLNFVRGQALPLQRERERETKKVNKVRERERERKRQRKK